MNKYLFLIFFVNVLSSNGQIKTIELHKPKRNSITNYTEFKAAFDYFEKITKYNNSTYNLSKDYLKLANNCLKWSKKYEDEQAVIKVKFYIFYFYKKQSKFLAEAIYHARELLTFDSFLEMKEAVLVLSFLKTAYNNSKQYEELLKILPLYYGKFKNKHTLKNRKNNIHSAEQGLIDAYAHLYFNLRNYKQSKKYFKLQLQNLKSIKSNHNLFQLISTSQNNLGVSYFHEKKYDSALFYFNKALKNLQLNIKKVDESNFINLNHFINIINSNISKIDIVNKEFEKALPAQFKVLKSSIALDKTNIQQATYYRIAKIYYFKKQPIISLKYLDSLSKLNYKSKNNRLKIDALELKAKNLLLKGDVYNANIYFERKDNLVDSLEQLKINKNYTKETIKLDVENKTKELLESKKEVKRKEIKGLIHLVAILSLLLIMIVLFIVYKKNKDKSKIIINQKKVVVSALEQKEILLKELHHRVKNNLQLITSLLNLQLHKHQHLNIEDIINESQNYIHSIALAHEMLYNNNDLSLISMPKYLKELGMRSLSIYDDNSIIYITKIEKISLPINYATTLGLIFNELITNSLKHAFVDDRGKITVCLSKESNGGFKFTYKDNGIGMDINSIKKSSSLGLKLIKMLSEEINASMHIESNGGLFYTFKFSEKLSLNGK
ncbi:histidine kinase dimerization/phosphoacceptor domain -containing protein [Polaribacter sp. Asnod1-A03]|uniref:histidine kinase dimerization/phosphoacceptor domain -containing protein n=1 Tax=Polaribacter sp. Asnod1-A03 TaxID=3160581 RepID=UPI00386DDF26